MNDDSDMDVGGVVASPMIFWCADGSVAHTLGTIQPRFPIACGFYMAVDITHKNIDLSHKNILFKNKKTTVPSGKLPHNSGKPPF